MTKYFSTELMFWVVALAWLALTDPAQAHFSFCLLKNLGISFCPGCDIGHSISHLLHGDWQKSFQTHWLGTFALVVIVYRILQLIIKKHHYGKSVYNA